MPEAMEIKMTRDELIEELKNLPNNSEVTVLATTTGTYLGSPFRNTEEFKIIRVDNTPPKIIAE